MLHRRIVVALGLVLAAGCADPNARNTGMGTGAGSGTAATSTTSGNASVASCDSLGSGVVASADGIQITGAEVESATAAQAYQQRQQIYQERSSWAENEIAKRLIKREAEKAGMGFDDFLAKKVDVVEHPVSDADVKMFYQSNPQMMRMPDGSTASLDQIKGKIREYLEGQQKQQSRQQYVSKLMEDNHAKVDIVAPEPPVVNVSLDDDPSKGPKNAPVTVVEFSDFQCPACRSAFQHLDEVLAKYGDKVHFVYRDYPLLSKHPNAFPAAVAADCVLELGGQEKYWSYHHTLFTNQQALDADSLKRYATDLKIDGNKFTACTQGTKAPAEVKHDLEDGDSYGINSTPTFFVNGRMIPGANMTELQRLIDQELKKAGA